MQESTTANLKLAGVSYEGKNALAVAIHREDDKYDIYNAHGQFVRQINSSKTPTIKYYANGEVEKSAAIISYEGGMIILKNYDLSEIANVSTPYEYEVRVL